MNYDDLALISSKETNYTSVKLASWNLDCLIKLAVVDRRNVQGTLRISLVNEKPGLFCLIESWRTVTSLLALIKLLVPVDHVIVLVQKLASSQGYGEKGRMDRGKQTKREEGLCQAWLLTIKIESGS